jgi:hypothetical protein
VSDSEVKSKSEASPHALAMWSEEAHAIARAAIALTPLPTDVVRAPLGFEPDIGEQAVLECKAALLAMDAREVQTPRCDCSRVSLAAMTLVTHIEKPRVSSCSTCSRPR